MCQRQDRVKASPIFLNRWCTEFPARKVIPHAPFKALIVDSWFDNYLGIVSLLRVVDGSVGKGQKIKLMSTGNQHQVEQVGCIYAQA